MALYAANGSINKDGARMKFTFSWLKDHLETTSSLDEISSGLTRLGLEVEGIEDRAAALSPFCAAYVETATRHPDADRLQVLTVKTLGSVLQVVCGAPNARAGMMGIFAPAGSVIPKTGDVLKKGMIRGVESNGMMVSEAEMGLSDNHEGIIEIDPKTPIGTPLADVLGLNDPVIDIKLTPNRGDCAGVRGIARDLAAAGYGTLKPLSYTADVQGTYACPLSVDFQFLPEAADACSLFAGRLVRGVKNGPSPKWMQDRLQAIGLRPISALVDITNYMTIDLNRPLHVFDASKIKGNVHVRLSRTGETLSALNDKTYTLNDQMTCICDDAGVMALGGVMGGSQTGCTEQTTDVFIESAYFNPLRTARTGRTLALDSDARYRFERGVDPAFTLQGLNIATQLVITICGGDASRPVITGPGPAVPAAIAYRPSRVQSLAGVDIVPDRQKAILETLGFHVKESSAAEWAVTAPTYRPDIEGEADLVEEIIRVYGYEHIPAQSVLPDGISAKPAETPLGLMAKAVRGALCARCISENITYSFISAAHAQLFGWDAEKQPGLRLKNPISVDWDTMRPSIIPGLLMCAGRADARGMGGSALFEVGPTFRSPKPDGQDICVSGIRHLMMGPAHWADKNQNRAPDVYDAKADALAALESAAGLSSDKVQIDRAGLPPYYHPGRGGVIKQGAVTIGYFGEIHPLVLEQMDIKGPATGFEVFLNNLPMQKKKSASKGTLKRSALMPVDRDFAFIVKMDVPADGLIRAIRLVDRALITDARVFDVYAGKGVDDGHTSLAVRVTLQPAEKTLTDADIEDISSKIVKAAAEKTGARLRG
jgi:phenylalanyl-tRNA synthetase beta chain